MSQLPVRGRATVIPVLATSVLFGLLGWRFGAAIELLAFSALALFGIRLAMIDLAELRLPTALVMPLYPMVLGLLSSRPCPRLAELGRGRGRHGDRLRLRQHRGSGDPRRRRSDPAYAGAVRTGSARRSIHGRSRPSST
jgi:hypothetical protein